MLMKLIFKIAWTTFIPVWIHYVWYLTNPPRFAQILVADCPLFRSIYQCLGDLKPWDISVKLQGLSVPVACVGFGDPVRVLRLYTMNTLDEVWSIYCWDICTICRYQIYVLLYWMADTSQPTACWLITAGRCLAGRWPNDALILYCTVSYIAACVDTNGTVFCDRPKPKVLIIVDLHFAESSTELSQCS